MLINEKDLVKIYLNKFPISVISAFRAFPLFSSLLVLLVPFKK